MKLERKVFTKIIPAIYDSEHLHVAQEAFDELVQEVNRELEGYRIINIIENTNYRNNTTTWQGEHIVNVVVWCTKEPPIDPLIDDFDETCK